MEYRPEIDGLRAVAVVPVILFHAGFRSCSATYWSWTTVRDAGVPRRDLAFGLSRSWPTESGQSSDGLDRRRHGTLGDIDRYAPMPDGVTRIHAVRCERTDIWCGLVCGW